MQINNITKLVGIKGIKLEKVEETEASKEEYEKESSGEFDESVIAGYEFVLESKKNELEVRGYDFNEWIKDKN